MNIKKVSKPRPVMANVNRALSKANQARRQWILEVFSGLAWNG